MKQIIYLFSLLLLLGWTSCEKEETTPPYKGKNEISLTAVVTSAMVDEEGAKMEVDLMLTKMPAHEVTLEFELSGHLQNGVELVSLSTAKIVIPANQKTGRLEIVSKNKGMIVSNMSMQITLSASSDPDITLLAPFHFTVKPGRKMPVLTEAQMELLKSYEQKGWNIRQWLGIIPVTVSVQFPGGAGYEPMDQPYTREIKGKTTITLSEKATEEMPVLKMTSNAMGIGEYLHELVRGQTILNDDYWWNATPNAMVAIRLLEMTKERAESFDAALDNLVFDTQSNQVDFVTEHLTMPNPYPDILDENMYDDIAIVNFDYTYSVWDRMKALIEKGNTEIMRAYSEGGSMHPGVFLNRSTIDYDEFAAENNWTKPVSSFNFSTGALSFVFCLDHDAAIDYIRFTVNYTPVK